MLHAEATIYTSRPDAYAHLLRALGLSAVDELTFAAGRGRVRLEVLGVGDARDGTCEHVVGRADPSDPPRARGDGRLSVLLITYTPDVESATADLRRRGARPRLSAHDGVWADFVLDDGLVAVHRDVEEAAELAFEYDGDVDALVGRLRTAGVGAYPIDETYARTVHVPRPDGHGVLVVNGRTDPYGFEAHDADPR